MYIEIKWILIHGPQDLLEGLAIYSGYIDHCQMSQALLVQSLILCALVDEAKVVNMYLKL